MNEPQTSIFKKVVPLFLIFFVISGIIFYWQNQFLKARIDPFVLFVANALLFFISCFNIYLHVKAFQNKNPNVALRTVLLTTILKLMVLAIAVLIYVVNTKNRSNFAIYGGMFLYVIYAVIELKIAVKINKVNR